MMRYVLPDAYLTLFAMLHALIWALAMVHGLGLGVRWLVRRVRRGGAKEGDHAGHCGVPS